MTIRLSKDQRNHVICALKAGSTVNDTGHHLGCSIQAIHYLIIRYSNSGYARVRTRSGHARMTTFRPYRFDALTHPHRRFNQQPLLLGVYGADAQKILNHFMQNNGPDIFQHGNARPHTARK